MMRGLVKKCTVLVCTISILSSSALYAQSSTENLTMDQVIEQAIENNGTIKSLELNDLSINDSIRKANQGVQNVEYTMKDFYEYSHMYDDTKEFDRFKNMSQSELGTYYYRIQYQLMLGIAKDTDRLLKEEKFIGYMFMFGNKSPELSKEDKYYKFIKNIELTSKLADNQKTKFENQKETVENTIKSQITKLYIQYFDLKDFKISQEQLLDLKKQNMENSQSLFNVGKISAFDFDKAKSEYEVQKLEVSKMNKNIQNLEMALKSQIGKSYSEDVQFIRPINSNTEIKRELISGYIKAAKESNNELVGLIIDRDAKKEELDLMNEYVETLTFDRIRLESEIRGLNAQISELESKIEINVTYALEDVIYKTDALAENDDAIEIAKVSFAQANESFNLGLIRKTDLNYAEINYVVELVNKKNAQRKITSSLKAFDLLINNGITY